MITEISDNFYRITLPMPFRLRHVHAYALVTDGNIALFDTGMKMPGAYEKMAADLASIGLSVASISDIYLTHVHPDHCGMTGDLQEKSKARIHLSAAANQVHAHFQQADYLIAQTRLFYARHGLSPAEIEAIVEEIEDVRSRITQFADYSFLQDNEIIQFGNRSFEVIFTPGHAPGHVCFFFREEELLLAGDHILPYIVPSLSPDICNESYQALQSYLQSLCLIEKLPINTIYPGHGNSVTDIDDRTREIRTQHQLKKQYLLNSIDNRPKTAYAICNEIAGAAAANWDDWEKLMLLNETYVYIQELKADRAINENIINDVLVYTAV